jgi:glycosyltransferase involved in cell wall biosynthesis
MDELSFESIVHVNEKGGNFGGTEEYVALLTSELGRRGVRSHLVCGTVGGTLPPGLATVDVVQGLATREPVGPVGPALVDVLARIDADVVYLHNLFDAEAVEVVAAMPRRGRLCWFVHDHFPTCLSELRWRRGLGVCHHRLGEGCLVAIGEGSCVLRHPDRTYDRSELRRRLALSRSLRLADDVIVVSEYMRGLLVEAEPALAGRIHLLPRPIRRNDRARRRGRRRPGDPAVVTVAGRITPEKGLDVLIEALGAVAAGPEVELCVAGVVEHEAYWHRCLELMARAAAGNPRLAFRHLGHLDYEATDRLLRRSDVVAVPSQWPEPFGAVALEAMGAGAAVVASRVGGLDTCIVDGRNGRLVPPDDTAAWAAALGDLLADPAGARLMAARGRAHARTHGTAEHIAALDNVVARRTGSVGARLIHGVEVSLDVMGADVTPVDVTGADVTVAGLAGVDVTGGGVTPVDVTVVDLTGVERAGVEGGKPDAPPGAELAAGMP